ncbi:hypothetical protein G7K71_14920 [Desulfofundulus sp. TPOSR]|uniref:hypothetical protein n=1 Tax=Desulfofundulus sp. TPOSR TaxID=2714340 RepID=UPI001408BD20|nr:hypothetical protein [Desulfofundulus sp. TPOSR]NHM28245.1 hypothetical protein [Desulfofundulus sp. TPOSR]
MRTMREKDNANIHTVVLAGRGSERFRPPGSRNRLKQFLRLFGERTMLQETGNYTGTQ